MFILGIEDSIDSAEVYADPSQPGPSQPGTSHSSQPGTSSTIYKIRTRTKKPITATDYYAQMIDIEKQKLALKKRCLATQKQDLVMRKRYYQEKLDIMKQSVGRQLPSDVPVFQSERRDQFTVVPFQYM